MGFLEERDLSDLPSIPEYYKGKTIFITGGSGFMGKVLIEKLLYSCSDLERIYLLLRSKKGLKPKDRLRELYNSHCFDRLRKEKPDIFEKKVFFIGGDCSKIGLGMSDEDRTLILNRTQIIFHGAASVRFDDSLKVAANLNLRGTFEMVELAKNVKNLEVFVHVSTSYANANRRRVDEVVYPAFADWRDTLKICEKCDENTLKILTPKYLGELPNTYVFTKQLAESVLLEQKGKLPIVILRPSIVISSISEPMVGWLENFNGPVGMMIAFGKGILQSVYSDPDVELDYMPVDVAIKVFIAGAWMRGTKKFEPTDDIEVYNCSTSHVKKLTMGSVIELGKIIIQETPLEGMIWYASGTVTKSRLRYELNVIFFHLLPAILVDMILWISGRNPIKRNYKNANWIDYKNLLQNQFYVSFFESNDTQMMFIKQINCAADKSIQYVKYCNNLVQKFVPKPIWNQTLLKMVAESRLVKLQRRIYSATLALHYFTSQQWVFTNTNILELREKIKDLDKNSFYYEVETIDPAEFFKNAVCGGKKFLLNEKMEDLPKAKAHTKRMQILDFVVRLAFYVSVFWFLINTEYVRGILNSCDDLLF